MLHSVKRDPNEKGCLILQGTADELIGAEDDHDESTVIDEVAGFGVSRTAPGRHDGHPAVTLTLTDEMGHREIGRMTVRLDAVHEEILTWTRWFVGEGAEVDAFVKAFENRNLTPKGWRRIKARQVEVGMTIADPELFPEEYPIRSMHLFPLDEDGPWSRDTLPSGVGVILDPWGDPFDSEDDVLVKES